MTQRKEIQIVYSIDDLKPGIIKINQLEKVYGRMFTSDEVQRICDTINEWFPYGESNLQKKCDNFLSCKVSVRENLNYVLFNNYDGFQMYNTNGEVVS